MPALSLVASTSARSLADYFATTLKSEHHWLFGVGKGQLPDNQIQEPNMKLAATCPAHMPLQMSPIQQSSPSLSACQSPCSSHSHSLGGVPSCAHHRELQIRGPPACGHLPGRQLVADSQVQL